MDLDPTRWLIRGLLALPTPLLRALSGGAAVVRGGRTLDPRFQFLFHAAPQSLVGAPGGVDEERAAIARGIALLAAEPEAGVRWDDFAIEGPGGALPVRLYKPPRQDPHAPMMVYAHGGGVVGNLSFCHAGASMIAAISRGPVLSVDYRLAPEHRFPAAIEDMAAAWRWACDNADRHGARPGTAAIGGESSGANFAAVLCQEIKRLGGRQPALQLLICAPLDLSEVPAALAPFGDVQFVNLARIQWGKDHYIGAHADPIDPRLSPGLSRDLAGLAPAVIATGGFDPMIDQGEAYARALKAADVSVVYRCYDSLPHGFPACTGVVPAAAAAMREIAALVRTAYEAEA